MSAALCSLVVNAQSHTQPVPAPAAAGKSAVTAPRPTLDTDECKLARRELTLAQSARPAEGRAARDNDEARLPRIEHTDKARDRVAVACFGRSADSAIRERAPAQPVAVPRPTESANMRGAPSGAGLSPTQAPPPVDVPRPAAITSCDAGGCLDSNGQRYSGSGPVLSGPKGPCTVQAGFVTCN
jgi:hypothetical protein